MLVPFSDWSLQMEKVLAGFIPPVSSFFKSSISKLFKISLYKAI